jgi:type IV secretory pathway VirB2 component (pilin)
MNYSYAFGAKCSVLLADFRKLTYRHNDTILFVLGLSLLYAGGSSLAHAGSGTYGQACNGILLLVEGTFGALITAVAGIGAIVASAVGGFKMAWSLVVVAVGAFILRSYITLFNGDCGGAAGGGCAVC